MDPEIHISSIDGTQMAAKITGRFALDGRDFEFTAIAFGRIGGQNVGVKLSEDTESELKRLGHDADQTVMLLQKKLLEGDLSLPEGLKKESFADG